MKKVTTKRTGRPVGTGKDYDSLIHVRLPVEIKDGLEEMRLSRIDKPSISSLIREILGNAVRK